MSLRSLKSNRTRYKNTLDKELSIGNALLEENKECVDAKDFALKLDACIKRLSNFSDKLEITNKKISLAVERTEEDAMEQLLTEDGVFMTAVIDCRDQLITIEKSLLNVNSPSEIPQQ